MAVSFSFELGVIITLATIVFSAGSFYMMGLFNSKKIDKIFDDVTMIKTDVTQLKIEFGKVEQRLSFVERQRYAKENH